jgi:predicted ester cyclase
LLFFADGFPGSSTEITNAFATEDQVVIEFTGRGTNTGPLHMPTGDVPPTGRNTELRFCEVFQIKDRKIVSLHAYYDLMTMLQQLGLVPAMG